jgi:hypothetical protein
MNKINQVIDSIVLFLNLLYDRGGVALVITINHCPFCESAAIN